MNFIKKERAILVPQLRGREAGLVALKSLLAGYGTHLTYEQLKGARERVVRLETIGQILEQFGARVALEKHPVDHLLSREMLPAIVVLRSSTDKPPHFIVVWNRIGPFLQVMDPSTGRRFVRKEKIAELVSQPIVIEPSEWQEVADSWHTPLLLRLAGMGVTKAEALLASHSTSCQEMATLDATIRMVATMIRKGGVQKGPEAELLLERLYEQALNKTFVIHPSHWSLQLESNNNDPAYAAQPLLKLPHSTVLLRGLPLIRIKQVHSAARGGNSKRTPEPQGETAKEAGRATTVAPEPQEPLTSEEPPANEQSLLFYLLKEGIVTPAVVTIALLFAAMAVFLQGILFRGFMELGLDLESNSQRLQAYGLLVLFAVTLFLLRWPINVLVSYIGRHLDGRLRLAVFSIIPHLSPQYFQDYSVADMSERIHSVRTVNFLTTIGERIISAGAQALFIIIGLAWIDWVSALLALVRTILTLTVTQRFSPLLGQQHLRLRSYLALLSRSYLDAMLGLVAVRTHGAEEALRYEYDDILVGWSKSKLDLHRAEFWLMMINQLLSYSLMGLIMLTYAARDGDPANFLLLFYWSISLRTQTYYTLTIYFMYIQDRSKAERFLELLAAPQERDLFPPPSASPLAQAAAPLAKGINIRLKEVTVELGGQTVLSDINLTIEAGSQVAIVGPSGAGKSTLVALLLGWYTTFSGEILIDGQPFNFELLQTLRQQTAWVNPNIQLWNRSLLYNLRYGASRGQLALNSVLKQAGLTDLLKRLPQGLQTSLGQGGRLLSGGEGQRVRFGRGLGRPDARLVILDEAFRGLDREKRRTLLAEARSFWPDSTLICITHDVGMTQDFERVLVIEDGRIVEDDSPTRLMAQPSRYQALLLAEKAVREAIWKGKFWRRLWLEEGQLSEREAETPKESPAP